MSQTWIRIAALHITSSVKAAYRRLSTASLCNIRLAADAVILKTNKVDLKRRAVERSHDWWLGAVKGREEIDVGFPNCVRGRKCWMIFLSTDCYYCY
jgi:hypothetical protein